MTRRRPELLLVGIAVPLVLGLLLVQALEEADFSRDQIGFFIEDTEEGVELIDVVPGEPAASAGLKTGDVLLRFGDREIQEVEELRAIKEALPAGEPIGFSARRGEEIVTGSLRPGGSFPLFDYLVIALTALSHLLLGVVAVLRRPGYLRAQLLLFFTVAVALEFALPGVRSYFFAFVIASLLLNGLQMGLELHLASVVPERQRWLDRWPFAVPLFYVAGFVIAIGLASWYLLEGLGVALPFTGDQLSTSVNNVVFPLWAFGVLALLGYQALTYPEPRGRQQAALVALGVVPWALLILLEGTGVLEALVPPRWQDAVWNLGILGFPLAIFVSLLREASYQERVLVELTGNVQGLGSIRQIAPLVGRQLFAAFHPKSIHVFYREADSREMTTGHTTVLELEEHRIPESSALFRLAEGYARPFDRPEETAGLPPSEERWLDRLLARLVVPLVGRDRCLIGLLILGEKKSEEPYTPRDRRLLQNLAHQIGLLYENIRLQRSVDRSRQVQREVLTRLAEEEIDLVKECPRCRRCYGAAVERCPHDDAELSLSTPVERTISGRYRLDRLVGRGGMGAIYEAHDTQLSRAVAVKILTQTALFSSDGAAQRFEREARLTARMSHPNVLAVFDYGVTHTGAAYLVTELLRGSNVQEHLRAEGKIAPARLASWIEQSCEGLQAAHRAHIVHRDLKPANLFVAEDDDGTERIRILDFGIAKALRPEAGDALALTATGALLGTFTYMSPEQLSGREADERSDLFSLGVITYEALTGRRPFRGDSPMELLHAISNEEPTIPDLDPVHRRVVEVLRRCLAADPERRYPDAASLQLALAPALRGLTATGSAPETGDAES